jgi:hypothetical protein
MKFAAQAMLGLSLLFAAPAFATTAPAPVPPRAAADPVHLRAVQDLLGAMKVEKTLNSVAGRSRYPTEAQRRAVYAKIDRTPPAEIYQRLAPAMAQVISTDTAVEMTRFYNSPYGRQVIAKKYTSRPQFVMPGMVETVPAEEMKERRRPAYVRASRELAEADPVLQHEAFKLLQAIDREKR